MKIKESVIETYLENQLQSRNYGSKFEIGIKTLKIILITEEKTRLIVDYEVGAFPKFDKNFIPNKGKIVSGTIYINLNDVETIRELKLIEVLNPE